MESSLEEMINDIRPIDADVDPEVELPSDYFPRFRFDPNESWSTMVWRTYYHQMLMPCACIYDIGLLSAREFRQMGDSLDVHFLTVQLKDTQNQRCNFWASCDNFTTKVLPGYPESGNVDPEQATGTEETAGCPRRLCFGIVHVVPRAVVHYTHLFILLIFGNINVIVVNTALILGLVVVRVIIVLFHALRFVTLCLCCAPCSIFDAVIGSYIGWRRDRRERIRVKKEARDLAERRRRLQPDSIKKILDRDISFLHMLDESVTIAIGMDKSAGSGLTPRNKILEEPTMTGEVHSINNVV
uniref:Uncharacterized protein n=1 Tax=Lotharella oceanica TaxID=641309 RepID=A0A7S2U1K5_9EUKA|mmetsp:Transcript_37628/g.69406  ORF Transcript_37628/g.69406 Transcript_37628/m.69406 type:complete len:299 (+) Transcript_37628:140-1036(+)|eukprot:CAMPEP_0170177126 /NCGR_PEP_ID=MMETSP0040_2-20121228/9843_1 /TAXON_ID=641309 /ORGANISM="Lotharella oceanica, Strain CCMP622" /LENGTH=298 /DNA_ID=CAMNT_0010419661 /DNA_START=138 /DNA_END=1034 /DNA_ORIENTATION=+